MFARPGRSCAWLTAMDASVAAQPAAPEADWKAWRTALAPYARAHNGRGRGMFGVSDHDAALVAETLAGAPAAGFFAAGEIGPVGGGNFMHGFTATLALFA